MLVTMKKSRGKGESFDPNQELEQIIAEGTTKPKEEPRPEPAPKPEPAPEVKTEPEQKTGKKDVVDLMSVKEGDILEMNDGSFLKIRGWGEKSGDMGYEYVGKKMRTDREGEFRTLTKEEWAKISDSVQGYLPAKVKTPSSRKTAKVSDADYEKMLKAASKSEQAPTSPKKTRPKSIDLRQVSKFDPTFPDIEDLAPHPEQEEQPKSIEPPEAVKELVKEWTKDTLREKIVKPKKTTGKSKTPESVKRTLEEAKEILDDLHSTEVPRIPDGLKVGDVINDKGEVFVVKEVKLSTPGDADDGGKFVFESIKDKAVLVMPFKEYREDAELRGTLQKRQEKIEGVPLNLQKGQSIWTPGGEEEVKVIDVVEKPNTTYAALKNGYVVLGFQPKEGRNSTYKEEVVPFSKIIRLRKNILLEKPGAKKPEETRPLMALIVKNQPVTNSPEEQFERIVKVPASDLKSEDAGKKIFKSGDQVSVENLGEGWKVLGTFYSEEQADKITADFEAFKSKEITKEQKRQEELEEAQKIREVLSQITTPNESQPEPVSPVVEAAPSSQFIERTINKKPWWKFWN